MLSYLHKFCSEEVKLILARMNEFPDEFISSDIDRINKIGDLRLHHRPWRELIEHGTYSIVENIVLAYSLRLLDKKNTKIKIYEIFI